MKLTNYLTDVNRIGVFTAIASPAWHYIHADDLEIEGRLTERLVFGRHDLLGLLLVARIQALTFAGCAVNAVEPAATDPGAHQAITFLHCSHVIAMVGRAGAEPLARSSQFPEGCAAYSRVAGLVSVLVSVADPSTRNSLLQTKHDYQNRQSAVQVNVNTVLGVSDDIWQRARTFVPKAKHIEIEAKKNKLLPDAA